MKKKEKEDGWLEIGVVGVDSGHLVICDPCYIESGEVSYKDVMHDDVLEKGYSQLDYKMGHAGAGVVFTSGWGDGLYTVYAKIKDFGKKGLGGKRITEIKIVLI